ncbi:alpha-L-fucosidase [Duganella sp. BJB1802]|uniref:alpha-L-fucosidase n=1 Tax=Duganella sp. BJB1802 TaxID=2744575 RepID=UPI0015942C51|nr:alpha-L-fucosidase [Duganella sp. BJB1802]NVD73707.1 alpha-L-fucosidase [Duganella sp. BJB1802]
MKRTYLQLLAALACCVVAHAPQPAFGQAGLTDEQRSAAKSLADPGSLAPELRLSAQDMAWWRDAKLGIFIHWGLYALPGKGEWHMYNDKVPAAEYARLAQDFHPARFRPEGWAALARDAGARYMVMTARHHDGFAMFDSPSSYGGYDAMRSAAHTDFIAGYVRAARAQGLKVGIYYSPMDWRFPGYFAPRELADNAALMKRQAYGQVRELMANYGQIDVLWYDGGWLAHQGSDADAAWFWQPEVLNKMVRGYQPKVVINPRSGWQGDFDTEEGDAPITGPVRAKPWEKTFSLSLRAWGYTPGGGALAPERVIRLAVDAAIRNGNVLVNMSPDPDGDVPPDQVAALRAIGAWMGRNGASLQDTRPGPYQPVDGVYGSTVKGRDVYLHVLAWPGQRLNLPPLAQRVIAATRMDGRKVLVEQSASGVSVEVPAGERDAVDTVIRLEMAAAVPSLAP